MLHNDLNLQFRKAANNNDIKTLKSLKKSININSIGKDSKQTAAHRAAAAGHIETLQLLFNWGANFDLMDKDDKKPCDLAKSDEVKLLFKLIEEGQAVLQVRNAVFKKMDYECTSKEKEIHEEHWHKMNDYIQKKQFSDVKDVYEIYKNEAKTIQPTPEIENIFPIFQDKFQICFKQLENALTKFTTLNMSLENNDLVASCGQVAASCYAWLVNHKQVDFHVEEINLLEKYIKQAGHALLVFNRDNATQEADYNGWKNALIVDPYFNRIFFFNFRDQYPKESCVKIIEKFNIVKGIGNKVIPFPTELPLPKTVKAFNDAFALVDNDITFLMKPFYAELMNTESKKNSLG